MSNQLLPVLYGASVLLAAAAAGCLLRGALVLLRWECLGTADRRAGGDCDQSGAKAKSGKSDRGRKASSSVSAL